MSVALSRRLARVVLLEPIRSLHPDDRRGIANAAEDAGCFEDIPERYRRMILQAEAELEQLIAVQRARTPA